MSVRSVVLWSFIAATLSPLSAFADACKTPGSPGAQEITIDMSLPANSQGLSVSFQLGLEPAEFPAGDIAKIASPCSRGTIQVGANVFDVAGEDTDTPPRYATSNAAPEAIAYLALLPRPSAALGWMQKYQKDKNVSPTFSPTDMMYALVMAKGDLRFIVGYFDEIPDDARLKPYFLDTLNGKRKLLAGYDMKKHTMVPGS